MSAAWRASGHPRSFHLVEELTDSDFPLTTGAAPKLSDGVQLPPHGIDLEQLRHEHCAAARRMLGNFPQAFSHVALINTALNLTRSIGPAEQRGDGEAPC